MDKNSNLLSLTDEQVSENWKYGLYRELARLIETEGIVEKGLNTSYPNFPSSATPGSEAEHAYGSSWNKYDRPLKLKCSIVDVSNLQETERTWYDRDPFSDYGPQEFTDGGFSATVVCSCGQTLKAACYGSLAELINL